MAYDSLKVKPGQRATSSWANAIVDALNTLYYSLRITKVTTVTSDYTASAFELILVDASSTNIAITLPNSNGKEFIIIKRIDSSSNTVTINAPQGYTVEGSSSIQLASPLKPVVLVSDPNGNWWSITPL